MVADGRVGEAGGRLDFASAELLPPPEKRDREKPVLVGESLSTLQGPGKLCGSRDFLGEALILGNAALGIFPRQPLKTIREGGVRLGRGHHVHQCQHNICRFAST